VRAGQARIGSHRSDMAEAGEGSASPLPPNTDRSAAVPSLASLPGDDGVTRVVVGNPIPGAPATYFQSGTTARSTWQPSDYRLINVDDECKCTVSGGSRATLADFYERASAGSRIGARPVRGSPWDRLSAVSVIERSRSSAALRADEEVSSFTSRNVLRPVPLRSCGEENANPPSFRPTSRGSRASQGSRGSHMSECIGQVGTIVAGVVQDMLMAHREDTDRRQDVQLRMLLAHREETERRVIEARESADTNAYAT